jgi:hypothetical protein
VSFNFANRLICTEASRLPPLKQRARFCHMRGANEQEPR